MRVIKVGYLEPSTEVAQQPFTSNNSNRGHASLQERMCRYSVMVFLLTPRPRTMDGRCLVHAVLCYAEEQVTALLSNRRLPARGWDDAQIEYLLTEISLMDSNNFSENVGVGEREGRVSDLIRLYNMMV